MLQNADAHEQAVIRSGHGHEGKDACDTIHAGDFGRALPAGEDGLDVVSLWERATHPLFRIGMARQHGALTVNHHDDASGPQLCRLDDRVYHGHVHCGVQHGPDLPRVVEDGIRGHQDGLAGDAANLEFADGKSACPHDTLEPGQVRVVDRFVKRNGARHRLAAGVGQ